MSDSVSVSSARENNLRDARHPHSPFLQGNKLVLLIVNQMIRRLRRDGKIRQQFRQAVFKRMLVENFAERHLRLAAQARRNAVQQRFFVDFELAQQAAKEAWSVRELERQIAKPNKVAPRQPPTTSDDIAREQTLWSEQLGADVKLRHSKAGAIRITITASSLDEYQGIRERLGVTY